MKVLLVCNYMPDKQPSMQAFGRMLERGLPGIGCELRVISPPRWLHRVPAGSGLRKWLGYVDKFVLFIPALVWRARWADVVHICDHSNAMYVRWTRRKPTVVTCHDVIAVRAARGLVEGWHVGWPGRLFQRLIAKGLSEADLVACVSETTRRELLGLQLSKTYKVTTVLNGLNDSFEVPGAEEIDEVLGRLGPLVQGRYLLHVGGDLPRKNRQAVVETFIALHRHAASMGVPPAIENLIFVGPELSASQAALADRNGIADRVATFQDVSHRDLRVLYTRAAALLFPSLDEGFGWPVIEAQACGCPVVTSDLAPMNEIGGPGACYVDPHNPQGMARAIEQAAGRFDQMRALGLENVRHYSTAQMMSGYVAAYRRAMESRQSIAASEGNGSRL